MAEMTDSLILFTEASRMLAEANTIVKAKELMDLALTAADWAKRKGMGDQAIQYARSYALEAERRMGQLLKETDRADGGDATRARLHNVTEHPPTLAELGLDKRESVMAQKLADLTEEKFAEVRDGLKTKTQMLRDVKRDAVKREVAEFPSDKYRVIYADPPWAYSDKCEDGAVQAGGSERHYPAMTLVELCALPIRELADDNAVLFLWATSPMLPEAMTVATAWGFAYKASFIWDKIKHNMGHYNSVRHELLLICTRGSCLPDSKELIDSVQSIERTEHSVKPEAFRVIIDQLYPAGKRIELFARRKVANWEAWGNEC